MTDNPLRLLFDFLDESLTADPEKLARMVEKQKRALMSAYHPDSNKEGPFGRREAEARFKAINDSPDIACLVDALELLAGKKPETYEGEKAHSQQKLDSWIRDYRRSEDPKYAELLTKYGNTLKMAADLSRIIADKERKIGELELRLAAREPSPAGFYHGFFGEAIRDMKLSAEKDDYSGFKTAYATAKKLAGLDGFDFDRRFEGATIEIVENYIKKRLYLADSYESRLHEDGFIEELEKARKAANDFDRLDKYQPLIDQAARNFVNRAERTARLYGLPLKNFATGKRVAEKFGVDNR